MGGTDQATGKFTVSAGQLGSVSYVGGSVSGSEDVYARVSDGSSWSEWKGWYMNTTLAS